jgi:hypothetical protein
MCLRCQHTLQPRYGDQKHISSSLCASYISNRLSNHPTSTSTRTSPHNTMSSVNTLIKFVLAVLFASLVVATPVQFASYAEVANPVQLASRSQVVNGWFYWYFGHGTGGAPVAPFTSKQCRKGGVSAKVMAGISIRPCANHMLWGESWRDRTRCSTAQKQPRPRHVSSCRELLLVCSSEAGSAGK